MILGRSGPAFALGRIGTTAGELGQTLRRPEAVARVLATEGHQGKIYELIGDYAGNYDELAAALPSTPKSSSTTEQSSSWPTSPGK